MWDCTSGDACTDAGTDAGTDASTDAGTANRSRTSDAQGRGLFRPMLQAKWILQLVRQQQCLLPERSEEFYN
jgi:hypothetical protein